ncbi:two-component sensor histidine kinase [Bacillus halotolerans]|uniref:cache domain-containing sensor histidine kinase n=1 Tax=Bacillus halotolerans TaxID=260554 RepID=UPI000D01C0BD|nr:sensor histidine kinase [Bacillus halotolerans]PRP50426.1 two-component sensor histidine kinase [Bacillus halotolerans]PRP58832.1 two-component sensor histidine kinase [Bacillus halotolerans]PRP62698.1 two-component sensor histidine kinase [Bacillus halotolerans]
MKGRVTGWYRRMKIKDKLFVFLSLIMAVSFLFVYSGVQYAFHVYDEQIYRKSSEVLRMSSERIEDELKKIEDVSYEIITDEQIQRILSMQNRDDTYDQYQMKQELWDQLAQYAGDEKYIDSIHLIDARGSEYSAGSSSSDLMKQQEEVFERAKAQKGRNLWMTLGNSDPVLISARQIRSFHQLSLNGLGMVLIQVNVKQMIRDLPKDWGDSVGDMMIADKDGNLVYSAHASVLTPEMTKQTLRHPGYDLVKKNGKRYFISFLQSSYQNWSYYNVIPFDQMFAKISFMKTVIGTCFLLFFSVVLLFGRKIANSITEPIEQLVSAMKSVQHGGIEAGVSLSLPEHTQDEAGTLNRHFTVMMKRINELMEENVEKQLIIKETELKALQAQINPHFLYNTLESINWLAKANQQKQISQMVESLGFLLRNSIHIKEDTVTLQEEADIVLHYMTIQRFRFEERLNFTLDIADEVKHCRIPKLTLQPLAENAIQYALEPFTRPCAIRLQAKKTEECVCITVEDNGPGMDERILEKTGGRGIGLWNIHERIRLMFGEPYGLRIQSEKGKGTAILLTIPCRNEVV